MKEIVQVILNSGFSDYRDGNVALSVHYFGRVKYGWAGEQILNSNSEDQSY